MSRRLTLTILLAVTLFVLPLASLLPAAACAAGTQAASMPCCHAAMAATNGSCIHDRLHDAGLAAAEPSLILHLAQALAPRESLRCDPCATRAETRYDFALSRLECHAGSPLIAAGAIRLPAFGKARAVPLDLRAASTPPPAALSLRI